MIVFIVTVACRLNASAVLSALQLAVPVLKICRLFSPFFPRFSLNGIFLTVYGIFVYTSVCPYFLVDKLKAELA